MTVRQRFYGVRVEAMEESGLNPLWMMLGGLGLLFLGLGLAWSSYTDHQGSMPAHATIVTIGIGGRNALMEYPAPDGTPREATMGIARYERPFYREGNSVETYYDPASPDQLYMNYGLSMAVGFFLAMTSVVMLYVAAVASLFRWRRNDLRKAA